MPRAARIVLAGFPHHITQRGNNRQDVFFVDDDSRVYLDILGEQAERYGLTVQGWCLMTNHIHLIATPAAESSLARAVGRTHFLYTQYINSFHGRSGHLWQNRFYSCALDRRHFFYAMRYLERNPIRAKLCRNAWSYRFSSAAAHIGKPDNTGLLDHKQWRKQTVEVNWKEILQTPLPQEQKESLRLNTHRGRPLANDRFLSKLETKINRRLRPLPVGRPRRNNR